MSLADGQVSGHSLIPWMLSRKRLRNPGLSMSHRDILGLDFDVLGVTFGLPLGSAGDEVRLSLLEKTGIHDMDGIWGGLGLVGVFLVRFEGSF